MFLSGSAEDGDCERSLVLFSFLVDVDECGGDNKCSTGAECVNTNGSYICECAAGHRLLADQRTCEGKLFLLAHEQWCIAKNGGGYTQRGVAKGLKVPCLFMITVKKNPAGCRAYSKEFFGMHNFKSSCTM